VAFALGDLAVVVGAGHWVAQAANANWARSRILLSPRDGCSSRMDVPERAAVDRCQSGEEGQVPSARVLADDLGQDPPAGPDPTPRSRAPMAPWVAAIS
jgi:hypothetical protein